MSYSAVMDDRDLGRSAIRLWKMIAERAETGTDVAAIDQRIWDLFGEEWTVMFTDLAGFSRNVEEFGIVHFLQVIWDHTRLLTPVIADYDGLLLKTEGDSMLLLFRRPRRAVDCALAMQRACAQVNQRRRPEDQILLCIGLGHGRVLRIGDEDVWGQEVNAASKLGEDTAKAGEILVTAALHAELAADATLRFEPIGEVTGSKQNYRLRVE
ncbi:MAG: adenylate/guanylate cyclase domain-containing protein [Polyangiaceae bacterium]|nr:adenylate/guanylate cyclase domain-containing protein [Polyangiaceae bacterium]